MKRTHWNKRTCIETLALLQMIVYPRGKTKNISLSKTDMSSLITMMSQLSYLVSDDLIPVEVRMPFPH